MKTQLLGGAYSPVTSWARYVPHKRSYGTRARATHAAEHLAGRGDHKYNRIPVTVCIGRCQRSSMYAEESDLGEDTS